MNAKSLMQNEPKFRVTDDRTPLQDVHDRQTAKQRAVSRDAVSFGDRSGSASRVGQSRDSAQLHPGDGRKPQNEANWLMPLTNNTKAVNVDRFRIIDAKRSQSGRPRPGHPGVNQDGSQHTRCSDCSKSRGLDWCVFGMRTPEAAALPVYHVTTEESGDERPVASGRREEGGRSGWTRKCAKQSQSRNALPTCYQGW